MQCWTGRLVDQGRLLDGRCAFSCEKKTRLTFDIILRSASALLSAHD